MQPSEEGYTKVVDGEWIEVGNKEDNIFHHKCCDCKLVHVVKFKVVKDSLYLSFTREKL